MVRRDSRMFRAHPVEDDAPIAAATGVRQLMWLRKRLTAIFCRGVEGVS